MKYLIGGSNRFFSDNAKERSIRKWKRRNKEGEVVVIDADELSSPDNITNVLGGNSLFASTSLYVIKRLQKSTAVIQEAILETLYSLSLDVIVWEDDSLDKRKKLYKFFNSKGIVENHEYLSAYKVRSWIQKESVKRNISLDSDSLESLQIRLGNDQHQLANALTVLANYSRATSTPITQKEINLLIPSTLEEDIWKILDSLGDKGKQKLLQRIDRYVTDMSSYSAFVGLIGRQLRLLTQVKVSGPNADRLKIHPFVLKKIRMQSKRFSISYLRILYRKLIDTDIAVKSGFMDYRLAIELYITLF